MGACPPLCVMERAAVSHCRRLSRAACNPADDASQPKHIDLNSESDTGAGEGWRDERRKEDGGEMEGNRSEPGY